ncbi:sigma-70 family RNA polymerase sigma factor [Ilyomonas limi]|uniref:Sigma-70 family RNA polymerase sigma factor n=1 Tax=Ilyomonas limi TaxID=2575867 RepID=A0A4U3L6Y8_9BACT|nr:sigma-70 family RNA polymerase sigma factor [Ilyomonas limi]TKK71018.1 sigma-70 family RNA polymerase sigma factor [Ilyomonas limi]
MMATNDQILWNLLRKGSVTAFEDLFNRYWEALFQTAYKLIKNREDAEEIVSDFFIHLWSVRNELPEVQQVNAYLTKAVRNRAWNCLAKQKPIIVALTNNEENINSYSNPYEKLNTKEQERMIQSHVNQLPEKMRIVYCLHTFQDLSINQIAEQTRNSPQTVRNQLNTAYKKMKTLLLKGSFTLIVLLLEKIM